MAASRLTEGIVSILTNLLICKVLNSKKNLAKIRVVRRKVKKNRNIKIEKEDRGEGKYSSIILYSIRLLQT